MDGRLGGATEAPISGVDPCASRGFDKAWATVALDLQTPLAQLGLVDGFYVVVEDIPAAVRLSRGRQNGDLNWSLAPGELEGVYATIPATRQEAFVLPVRVLVPDPLGYEFASTAATFDLVVASDRAQPIALRKAEGLEGPLASPHADQAAEERRLAAARAEGEAEARAAFERAWDKRAADEQERWSACEAELCARCDVLLAAAEARYRQQLVDRLAAADAQWSARLAVIEARRRAETERAADSARIERRWPGGVALAVLWVVGISLALSAAAMP